MSNAPGDVDARHLGRLAAEQRAAGGLAGLGHAADDLGHEVGVERRCGDVVEEEQRARRLHEDVADAVVDDVHAGAADLAEAGGQLDLGADAVGRGHQHRVVHRQQGLGREGAAEAADAAHDLGAVGALDGRLQLGDGPVALVDVDAGGGVGAQRGAGRPPADVAPHLHALEARRRPSRRRRRRGPRPGRLRAR